jgi:hypothetical protein
MIQFFRDESAEAGMRGAFVDQGGLFSYIAPEARVPANHPLRKIRELVRGVLGELNRSLGRLYASEGRPSIPPEQLLSALLLQVFYGIRSERQLMEQTFCSRGACGTSEQKPCSFNAFCDLPRMLGKNLAGKFCSRFCRVMFAFGCGSAAG